MALKTYTPLKPGIKGKRPRRGACLLHDCMRCEVCHRCEFNNCKCVERLYYGIRYKGYCGFWCRKIGDKWEQITDKDIIDHLKNTCR